MSGAAHCGWSTFNCKHMNVVLIGNEETGLKAIKCGDCGSPLDRRVVGDRYEYFAAPIGYCDCEHSDHGTEERSRWLHAYGKVDAFARVKTRGGTFDICRDCAAMNHMGPYEGGNG